MVRMDTNLYTSCVDSKSCLKSCLATFSRCNCQCYIISTCMPTTCSYVDFTFSVACNGSNILSGRQTEPVIEYRSSEDWSHWIAANSSKYIQFIRCLQFFTITYFVANVDHRYETVFILNDDTTKLQLRWIQNDTIESAPWFIDEIFVDCSTFSATITFEEIDRLENHLCMHSFIIYYCQNFISQLLGVLFWLRGNRQLCLLTRFNCISFTNKWH